MQKELEKVAELWADQILNGEWDNGEPSHNFLGSLLRGQAQKPTDEQLSIFKQVLIEECKNKERINLGVDYHPDKELSLACKKSGISEQLLPVKSVVFASPGKVSYKFGYGRRITEIKI